MNKKIKFILCVALVLVAILSLAACGGKSKITKENFDKITCATLNYETGQYEGGMTYEEVEDILGKPTDSSSSSIMGTTTTVYVWGNEKKNITVSFINNLAISKIQIGL